MQKVRIVFLSVIFIMICGIVKSQVYSNSTVANANSWNTSITRTIDVSGLPLSLGGGNISLIQTNIHLGSQSDGTYNYSRYNITLTSPAGTSISVVSGNPNATWSFPNSNVREFNCAFRDNQYLQYPTSGSGAMSEPWHIGYYRTRDANAFSSFNGENPNGTWTITITENSVSSGARFNSADLVFGAFDYVDYTAFSDNDDCSTPYCLRSTEIVIGTNSGYSNQGTDLYNPNTPGCDWNQAQNNSAWFMFVADQPNVNISVSGITANLQILGISTSGNQCSPASISILSGGCPDDPINDTYLSPRYSNGSTNNNQLNLSGLTAGQTYYFVVDGTGGAVSPFYIEITGANDSCTDIISPPADLDLSISILSQLDCFGDADASALATASGGQPPYSFLWSATAGSQTTAQADNLSAGTYSVTVTDDLGATASGNITISQPTLLIASSSATPILCFGGNSTITVSASGGTPVYSGTGSFTESAGTYNYVITDANGCSATTGITITEPGVLTSSISMQAEQICSVPGSATVQAGGGTSPYTYLWPATAGGVSGGTASSLTAGTYLVTTSDANLCSVTQSVTISDLGGFTASAALASQPTCFGLSNGSADLTIVGGTAPYSISWSSGSGNSPITSYTINNLAQGAYTITITDINSCQAIASVTITEPTQLLASASASAILCNGGTSMVDITATGGTPGYTGTGSFVITAGTYNYTVTDANLCSANTSITINQPAVLTASSSATTILCNGGNSTVTVSANGGTPSYTGTGTFVVPAGTYNYSITDANGCSANTSIVVNQPASLIASVSASPILCFGGTATATVTVIGGTPAYSGTGSFSISAGNHNYTVTDANGCTASTSISVSQPSQLNSTISAITQQVCDIAGSAEITATNGTPPYSFSWPANAGGVSNNIATQLFEGTYMVTVYDANSCSVVQNISINDIGGFASNPGQENLSCFASADGRAFINSFVGANLPVSYMWSNGTNLDQITGLSAGTYYLTATDASGCVNEITYIITEPQQIIIDFIIQPATCGSIGGNIQINTSGGSGPYSGLWSDNISTLNRNNLNPGNYSITINDNNNCTATASTFVGISGNIDLILSQASPVQCFGENSASLIATTNSSNLPITWMWSNGGSSAVIYNLYSGQYSVSATDAWGCTGSETILINDPPQISINFSKTNVSCFGLSDGSATAIPVHGTAPYTYQWNNSGQTATISNLQQGTYLVTVTDRYSCSAESSVYISAPLSELQISNSFTDVSCYGENDGTAYVQASGGTSPYSYRWTTAGYSSTQQMISGLFAGNYSIIVEDANGCDVTDQLTINQPSELEIITYTTNPRCIGYNDGSIQITVSGGTGPYTYSWAHGISPLPEISGLYEGQYVVTVTDFNNCSVSSSNLNLYDTQVDCIRIPDAFTPNADGINDTWIIEGIELFPTARISVFNRWGQKLFDALGSDAPWDGTYNDKFVPTGPYLYVVELFNRSQSYVGIVTVIY